MKVGAKFLVLSFILAAIFVLCWGTLMVDFFSFEFTGLTEVAITKDKTY